MYKTEFDFDEASKESGERIRYGNPTAVFAINVLTLAHPSNNFARIRQ